MKFVQFVADVLCSIGQLRKSCAYQAGFFLIVEIIALLFGWISLYIFVLLLLTTILNVFVVGVLVVKRQDEFSNLSFLQLLGVFSRSLLLVRKIQPKKDYAK